MAGTLDVGVGYSAHYSDWMANEEGTPEDENVDSLRMWDGPINTTGGSGDLTGDEVGLPADDAWLIAVGDEDDAEEFLDNTEYQSFNDDGLDDCPLDDGEQADDAEAPVINLEDVKPGDFGEVTFDFRICDNPGFVWLNGQLESAAENGLTEPEADDPQEDGDADSTDPEDVELLDVVQTAVWVDDGDNYQDGEEEPLAVQSLRDLLMDLDDDGNRAGVPLAGNTSPEEGGAAADARNCFAGDEKHSFVFAWWVPIDHGNQIQSDQASFRLGLYTEQCRHNDGSGMNNEGLEDEVDDDQETSTPAPS
ncbi:hypothetical protein [Haloplanus salinarum]